MITEPLGVHIQ